ncbi:Glutamate [NMDA] receptor subunit 1 [Armadillidium nasatum]|uniref:Glutamate [NMDA] receptor subunit 1 n=1 Tax=Armadillidium nasatum TaxID=96803 RepID=A0A5N5T6R5_9CRUS|nr:Glutamate [NMDA] receptor subunit 1 [Armadillidium nasatum]
MKTRNTLCQNHLKQDFVPSKDHKPSVDKSYFKSYDEKPVVEDVYEDEDIKSRRFYGERVLPDSDIKPTGIKTKEDEYDTKSRGVYKGVDLPDNLNPKVVKTPVEDDNDEYLNFDGVSVSPTCTLYNVTIISSGNPIRDARLVCENIITKGVFALIIGGGNMSSAATSAVSYTGGFYHIPVIGTSARESAFSDKNIHVSFLRTVPPFSHQADVWVKFLKELKFKRNYKTETKYCIRILDLFNNDDIDKKCRNIQSIIINQTSYECNINLDINLSSISYRIYSVLEFEPGQISYVKLLRSLKDSLVKVFLLFAR